MTLKVDKALQFHIIPVLLSLVICFFSFSCPVFASTGSSLDCVSTVVEYWDFSVDLFQRNVLDCLHRFDLYLNVCSGADSNGLHDFALQNIDGTHSQMVCQYCGLTAAEVYGYASDDYTDSLDSTVVSTSYEVTGFSVSAISSYSSSVCSLLSYLGLSTSTNWYNTLSLIKSLGVCDRVLVCGVGRNSPYELVGFYFDSSGRFCLGYFNNPLGYAYYGLLGVYDYSALSLISYQYPYTCPNGSTTYYTVPIYYSTSYADDIYSTSGEAYVFDFSASRSLSNTDYFYVTFLYRNYSLSSSWDSSVNRRFYPVGSGSALSCYYAMTDYIVWDNSLRIPVYGNSTSTADRVAPIFNYINNYNTTNNYTDNSEVVNYYIGTTDDTGDVTNIYNVALYDEDTLIFTEPVTETQYQTTGWTYDYTTRTYTLDLDSGTFYIGDYDIDTIDLTYGDDALTITYYADGVAITTDEYVYVMVSQSECALNGHTYSLDDYQAPSCGEIGYYDYVCSVCGNEYLETIDATGEHSYEYSIYQNSTCTSEGIGLYICSVCGNQYTEPISATGHSYEYSVYQDATCTTDGIGIYTCSECGDQYTEILSATGHDWLATSVDETTYSFPDGESCPDCGSESFTYELDPSSETYTVTCSDCGTTWTVDADVTYGGITYTCSICGETYFASDDPNYSDSLFGAIANFISSGISWIIEKFTSLIESISGLIDTFNEYIETLSSTSGSFPAFLAGVVAAIPDELTVILWFAVIAFVVAAVWKKFFM